MVQMVIGLHEKGYHYDFRLYGENQLWGVQENRPFVSEEININQVCPIRNPRMNGTKFILAIETTDGCKGLLIGSDWVVGFIGLICGHGSNDATQQLL